MDIFQVDEKTNHQIKKATQDQSGHNPTNFIDRCPLDNFCYGILNLETVIEIGFQKMAQAKR